MRSKLTSKIIIAHLEVWVLDYTLNDNKIEIIVDAYDENEKVILSKQKTIMVYDCRMMQKLSKTYAMQKFLKIMDEFNAYRILPDCEIKVVDCDDPEFFKLLRYNEGKVAAIAARDRREAKRAERERLSPGPPTTRHNGQQTPPNMKSNVGRLLEMHAEGLCCSNPYLITINAKDKPLTWMKYQRYDPLGDYDHAQRQRKQQNVNKMLLSLKKSTSDMSIQFQTCTRIWMHLLEIRSQENWNVFWSNLSLLKELSGQNWRICQQVEREMRGEYHVEIEESSKVRGRIDNWIKRAHSASALLHV